MRASTTKELGGHRAETLRVGTRALGSGTGFPR